MYLRRNKLKILLNLLPLFLILLVIGSGVVQTFRISGGMYNGELETLNLDYYLKAFKDKEFLRSFLFTFKTAFISSSLSIIFGVFVGINILNYKRKVFLKLFNGVAIYIPHLMAGLFMLMFFSQTGVIARIFYKFGLITNASEFPQIVNDRDGLGIILAYIFKGMPFVTMVIYNFLKNIDKKEVFIAKTLKARDIQVLKYIILPKITPIAINIFIILFVFSFSAYEIPSVLGSSGVKALPIFIYEKYKSIDLANKSYAMTMNMINIVFLLLFSILIYLFSKKARRN